MYRLSLFFFLQVFSFVCCLPWLLSHANASAFKCFWQMLPGKSPQTWECSKWSKTKTGPCAGPLGSYQRSWNTLPQFFETHIHIAPSNAGNLYQGCMPLTSWTLLLWGWATVDGQSETPQRSYWSVAASVIIRFSPIAVNFWLDSIVLQKLTDNSVKRFY